MAMFDYVKMPKNVSEYTAFRGVTDFTNLKQFDLFEKGHSFLTIISTPRFMRELRDKNDNLKNIYWCFMHMLEFEFRGLSGLPDITGETQEITDGIATLNIITKTQADTAVNIQMTFYEKSGALIEKFMEIYLTGIKDPKTEAKHYHGLIDEGILPDGSYEYEIFHLLYYVVNNTYTKLERAYLLCNWQPNKAETSMYDSAKGTIEIQEVTIEGNCYPVWGDEVDKRALMMLKFIRSDAAGDKKLIIDSRNFHFKALDKMDEKMTNLGVNQNMTFREDRSIVPIGNS